MSLEEFIGEMGQPLDHGSHDQNESNKDRGGDAFDIGSPRTYADIEDPPYESHVERCALFGVVMI